MNHLTLNNNFSYLTLSLVALLFFTSTSPLLPTGFALWANKLFILGTLIVAFLSLHAGKRWQWTVIFLLVTQITSAVARKLSNWQFIGMIDLSVMLIFFCGAAYISAKQVIFSGKVNENKIVGTIAIYLLLGLIWACFYLMILEFSPTAFRGFPEGDWGENFVNAIYFSFVTLTTLGYGDISPVSPIGKVCVLLEAITGVFYIAIVVASLVGVRTPTSSTNKD